MKLLILLSAFTLAGCSDTYRYMCQDPKNHNSPSCQPPVCETTGTCTKYLIGTPDEK